MLAEERRLSIFSLIQEKGSARTVELAETFRVSDQTIRRDLFDLEERGLIRKSHGGGALINYQGASYRDRALLRREEKLLIAREAVRQVKRGMTVALGPGTTTEEIARLLNGMDVEVVTNSLAVARAMASRSTKVNLTGGSYRPSSELLTGAWTGQSLEAFFADISFIGVSGIGADAGYTVTQADEALVLRQFIRIAKRAVVVADSSKFHRVAKAFVAPLEAVHMLITDAGIPTKDHDLLRARGVNVTIIGRGEEVAASWQEKGELSHAP